MQNPTIPFRPDITLLAIGPERAQCLSSLIQTARNDLRPRDFCERHLVDEMALNKWRLLRVQVMEKAVYEHEAAGYQTPPGPTGHAAPHDDMLHLALALTPERRAVVLAALGRLEARFHREFNGALRLLIALRRLNPFFSPEISPNLTQILEKENELCSPSPLSPQTT